MKQLDISFLTYASNVLGNTSYGYSGSDIVSLFNNYAVEYKRRIPYSEYPFEAPNKRTALLENLKSFEEKEQFKIISDMISNALNDEDGSFSKLKVQLFERYGNLAEVRISNSELVIKTKHWLEKFPEALKQYQSALTKYEGGIFERNTLDDMRLSLELLLHTLLNNSKTLENQIEELGKRLKVNNVSPDIRNLFMAVLNYYKCYQNNNVKHNDKINKNEIEYVIEQTSIMMKFLIQVCN